MKYAPTNKHVDATWQVVASNKLPMPTVLTNFFLYDNISVIFRPTITNDAIPLASALGLDTLNPNLLVKVKTFSFSKSTSSDEYQESYF
jgi:hypothetical protein